MKVTLAIIALLPFYSFSQSVYKCETEQGTTFSQTPCDDQYEKVDVDNSSGGSSNEAVTEKLEAACLSLIKTKVTFQDPDSARIQQSKKEWLSDKSGARQVLVVDVISKEAQQTADKNVSYGYGQARSHSCYLNHDGTRLSRIQYLVR